MSAVSPHLHATDSQSSGGAIISGSDLFSLQQFCSLQDQESILAPTVEHSTSSAKAEGQPARTSPELHNPSSVGIGNTYCTSSASPTMAQPPYSRRGFQGVWTQRTEASADIYTLQRPHQTKPLSPPPSSRVSQWDDFSLVSPSNTSLGSSQRPVSYQSAFSPLAESFAHQLQFTPLSSPRMDQNLDRHGLPYYRPTPGPNTFYPGNDFSPENMPGFGSPQLEHDLPWGYGQSTAVASPFNTTTTFQESNVNRWNPSAASSEQCRPVYRDEHAQSIMASFGDDSYSDDQAPLSINGLGIRCRTSGDADGIAAPRNSPVNKNDRHSVGAAPTRGRRQHSDGSITPSSPTARSKSRHASRGHRRSKTSSSTSRTTSVGFVNFTPDDSKRILTGVAPSGSSKTKARREKEQADKRKRLSQAVTRVMMETGGDVAALEGLFIP